MHNIMDKLVDLKSFRESLTRQIGSANWNDCTLPQSFKEAFTGFGQYRIEEFYSYSAKVSSAKSICIVPNQWFFVAACCSQYHTELMNYKSKLISLGISDDQFEACHPSSDSKISDDQKTPSALKEKAESFLSSYTGDDKELLVSFLWDYDSWGGGKNIKRQNDFTESPVLNVANFINASSGLVGAIAKGLADNNKALSALMSSSEWDVIFNGKPSSLSHRCTILGPVRGGYLNEGKRGFMWDVLKYFNGVDGLKEMVEGGLYRNPENKYAYIGPTPVAHIETTTEGVTVDTMVVYDGTILSKNSEVAEFYNGIDAFNKFYAGRYVIEVTNNEQGDEVYYLRKLRLFDAPLQKIYYGAPGTGKSHEVKIQTGELDEAGTEHECNNVFRTTFHPDTDYASFVGCYKPNMKPVEEKYRAVAGKDEDIAYEFVPQAFTDAYIYAYNNPTENTFLVIEEINRGNCAQIFGDLFQLLDRNEKGKSEYTIKADKDLAKYLMKKLGSDSEGIADGKLRLPANLHILATMNTSDQSLFPMDSAFKRRWDWEYVAISYTEPKSSSFQINVGKGYSWVKFIEQVNKRIFALTQSEDKEMGNFFIKKSINSDLFKSKVMFYLWYEVLRDEVENSKYFFYYTTKDENDKETNHKFTFKDLYGENSDTILEGFLKYMAKDAE